MRAIRVSEPGTAEVLRLQEVERPEPGGGEVLVEVALASVNYATSLLVDCFDYNCADLGLIRSRGRSSGGRPWRRMFENAVESRIG